MLFSEQLDLQSITRFTARYLGQGILVGVLVLIAWGIFIYLPVTYEDWHNIFKPAALHLDNPYHKAGVIFNPPWLFPFLYPVARLPYPAGVALLMVISVFAVALYVGSPKKTLVVAFSAPMAALISLGQLDALLLFGLLLPGGLGLPILLLKPQAVFLTILPRLNRRSLAVLSLFLIVSVLIWGFWWLEIIGHTPTQTFNVSLFPYSVIGGIPLAFWGFKRKSDALLCLASLCLAPYFMIHSLLPAVAALVRETEQWWGWAAIVLGSWLYLLAMKGLLF